MANPIDRIVGWGITRYAYARDLWSKANVDSQDRALIGSFTQTHNDITRWNADEQARIALTTSWIYADIRLLAQEVSAATIQIKELKNETKVAIINHPAEILFSNPNPYVDMGFIWQYTISWMQLRGNGYFFLAPEQGNPDSIAEIWPVPADRITPLPDKLDFLKGYAYKMPSGEQKFIKPQYIVHFQYPNPFSLLNGLAPLSAATLALETEQGTSTWQRDTYVTGKGVPHSIISLDPDTNERDFIAISSQIREDFEQERKIIVTRSGDLKVDKVGLSQKEMELVGQRQFTRDELDIVFLGFAIHTTQGRELATMYKMFQEKTVYSLHQMIAAQLNTQVIKPHYGNQFIAEFDDIRAQDRALNVQERNVYWRVKKFDEARTELTLPAYENVDLPGLGDLPVMLATDPQFVMAYFGIGVQALRPNPSGIIDPTRKKPIPNSSLSNSDAPVNVLSNAAKELKLIEAPSIAELVGFDAELARYKKVVLKALKNGKRVGLILFGSEIIAPNKLKQLRGTLLETDTEEKIRKVFDDFKADLRGGRRGRQTREIASINAYQTDLEDIYSNWVDDNAEDISTGDSTKIDLAIAALLLLLISAGRKNLPDAVDLAVGKDDQTPDMVKHLFDVMSSNEAYLSSSLIPDIKSKIQKALNDPDIKLAIESGEGKQVFQAVLATMNARIAMYAGSYWDILSYSTGLLASEKGMSVYWKLDDRAKHCDQCLEFGDTMYPSWEELLQKTGGVYPTNATCKGNCRCELQMGGEAKSTDLMVIDDDRQGSHLDKARSLAVKSQQDSIVNDTLNMMRDVAMAIKANIENPPTIIVNVPETQITVNVPEAQVVVNVPEAQVVVNVPETVVNVLPADVTVNLPETVVNVSPADVTVNVPAQLPPVVNIAPAEVTVNVPKQDAPVINVAAPHVTVKPMVKVEPTTEETDVIRDRNGLITGTVKRTS